MSDVALTGIVLVAENFSEQVAFYRDTLGLQQTDDWGDAVRFRASNGVELTLFASTHDPNSLDRLSPLRHGLSHLEFGVNADTRAELESRLDGDGRASNRGNYLDPDGQLFHFVATDD